MKSKHLLLAIAVLLAAGGLWLARSGWLTHTRQNSRQGDGFQTPESQPKAGHVLRPPDQARHYRDFTPEQRVEFARKGHGPGG